MAIDTYDPAEKYAEIAAHVGHEITCVSYGDGANVAIQCETCGVILLDENKPSGED